MKTKAERYRTMMKVLRQKEAANFLRDAPGLLNRLGEIDRERGGACGEAVISIRSNVDRLMRRKDLPMVEREALIQCELINLCHLINLARTAGQSEVDIVGEPDQNDTHYGAARIAASFKVTERSIA